MLINFCSSTRSWIFEILNLNMSIVLSLQGLFHYRKTRQMAHDRPQISILKRWSQTAFKSSTNCCTSETKNLWRAAGACISVELLNLGCRWWEGASLTRAVIRSGSARDHQHHFTQDVLQEKLVTEFFYFYIFPVFLQYLNSNKKGCSLWAISSEICRKHVSAYYTAINLKQILWKTDNSNSSSFRFEK